MISSRTQWIQKLYSGEYPKGTGQLHNPLNGAYCCLGVACTINPSWASSNAFLTSYGLTALGLSENDQSRLMRINDQEDMTFEEIGMFMHFCDLAGVTLTDGFSKGIFSS